MATAADIYAKARADEWLNQNKNKYYDTLTSVTESQKQAQQENYNKLINTLASQGETYTKDYESDARQAYLNSLQTKQALKDTLTRLGLGNTGLGQSQFLSAENQYAGNLAGLQGQLSKNLAGLNLEKTNAMSDLNSALATIDKDYYTNRLSLDKYIDEFYNSVYGQGLDQYNADRNTYLSSSYFNEPITSNDEVESQQSVDYGSYLNDAIDSKNVSQLQELLSVLNSDKTATKQTKDFYGNLINKAITSLTRTYNKKTKSKKTTAKVKQPLLQIFGNK